MNKRIVKETLSDGTVQYRVEKQTILCRRWVTDIFHDVERDMTFEAVFSTKKEAENHAYTNSIVEKPKVIKREIV